jgi:V8-like Glu-specific endopeptidase
VFFTKPGIGNYVCSGTIINTEGKDTVWTAGHCVHGGSGGGWHTNFAFVPAYDDDLANPRPYGTWTANQLWSKSAWTGSSDFSQDIGVAIMNTNFGGWHIVDYFGGQGITVNRGKTVWENAFGYPAEWPYDGGNLYRCWGTTSPEWDAWFTWSQTVKIPCDMTRGSSGGGWLYGYDGNWGYLNGVNSRIDRILNPTIMLSPYFDDDAWGLFNTTRYL